jgi:hypothetical protein
MLVSIDTCGAFVADRIAILVIRTRLHDLILLPGQLLSRNNTAVAGKSSTCD